MSDDAFVLASKVLPVFVYPLTLACLLIAAALAPRLGAGWRRTLTSAGLGVLLVSSCGPISRELARSLESACPTLAPDARGDAIVLLGGATQPPLPPRSDVELSGEADRLFFAARLLHEARAPRIVVSGGRLDPTGTIDGDAAHEMAEILGRLSVPSDAILLEARSRNTYENAVETRRVLAPLGANRILLVTSALHMPRAAALFRAQGFEVVTAPTDFLVVEEPPARTAAGRVWRAFFAFVPSAASLDQTTRVLREYAGLLVSWLQGRLA